MDSRKVKIAELFSQDSIINKKNLRLYKTMKYWTTPENVIVPIVELAELPVVNCTPEELMMALESLHNLEVDKESQTVKFQLRREQTTLILDNVPADMDIEKILEILKKCPCLAEFEAQDNGKETFSGVSRVVPQNWFNGYVWYVTLANEKLAFQVACWLQTQTYQEDEVIRVRIKSEPEMSPKSFFGQSHQFTSTQRHSFQKNIPRSAFKRPSKFQTSQKTPRNRHAKPDLSENTRRSNYPNNFLKKSINNTNCNLRKEASKSDFEVDDGADFPSLSEAIALLKIEDAFQKKKIVTKPLTQKIDIKSFSAQQLKRLDRHDRMDRNTNEQSTVKVC